MLPESKDVAQDKSLNSVRNEWRQFWNSIWRPTVILSSLLLIGLAFLQILVVPTNPVSVAASVGVTVMFAIVAGYLGTQIDRFMKDSSERTVLKTRAESAIRGLLMLSNQVREVYGKSKEYQNWPPLSGTEDLSMVRDLARATHVEIQDRCSLIQGSIMNAITEWNDIVPGFAVSEKAVSSLLKIDEMEKEQAQALQNVEDLKSELELRKTADNASKEERAQLELERGELEVKLQQESAEVKALEKRLNGEKDEVSRILNFAKESLSGLRSVTLGAPSQIHFAGHTGEYVNFIDTRTCPHCGESNIWDANLISEQKCKKCGKPLFSLGISLLRPPNE